MYVYILVRISLLQGTFFNQKTLIFFLFRHENMFCVLIRIALRSWGGVVKEYVQQVFKEK